MEWFAVGHELVLNVDFRLLPDVVRATWFDCMCLASRNRSRGFLPSIREMAFYLRMDEATMAEHIGVLEERGWIDYVDGHEDRHMRSWEEFQAIARAQIERMSGAQRQRSYRERKRRERQLGVVDGTKDSCEKGRLVA